MQSKFLKNDIIEAEKLCLGNVNVIKLWGQLIIIGSRNAL